jgi:uncharacterized protein (TIGR00299 family) protein
MRIAYLDCFSGISGDMFLGALIDAGVSPRLFEQAVEALAIGAKLEISRVNRSGITATKVDVIVNGKKDSPRLTGEAPVRLPPAGRSLRAGSAPHAPAPHTPAPHGHSHTDDHEREHGHHHRPDAKHGRGLKQIQQIIEAAPDISGSPKRTAIAIFEKLGAAEAKIHNIAIEKIHFHEVGAADAMVDIVCAAVGAEALSVDEFICSPLNVGGGTVTCAHGTFPVPAPATVELLRGAPVYSSGIEAELVTPTGAAIVATLVKQFQPFPSMKIEKTGYGAGTLDLAGHANVLRITLGEAVEERTAARSIHATSTDEETVIVLEANLDDLNPQVFGYVMDRLLEAGALDVFATPVQMKKNRPGTLLTVLAKPEQAASLEEIIFAETTTLGIRRREESRSVLSRKWATVPTRFGDVRIKIASLNGTVRNFSPEYEDCRRVAAEHHVPLKVVMQEAVQEYLKSSTEK